jgi:hypothetical protein
VSGDQKGQSTVEWLGLVLLVSLLIAGLALLAGARIPGLLMAKAVAERIVCAVRLSENCASEPELRSAHGSEIAAALRARAPTLLYEQGMTALPVDFRRCRRDACAAGPGIGAVSRSDSRHPVVAFTHVIDCRPESAAASESAGMDCSGPRAGNLYLQYWLYYPGSATGEGSTSLKGPIRNVSTAIGHSTYHPDDWESFMVRIGPGGRVARASSHHGYEYDRAGTIAGHRLVQRPDGSWRLHRVPVEPNGWGPDTGTIYVSGGSHAGRAGSRRSVLRTTKDHRLVLIPIESLDDRDAYSFAVTPPWRKRVFLDPEYAGTD